MDGDAERWGMKPRSSCGCLFINTCPHGMPTKPQFGGSDIAGEPHTGACRKHSLPSPGLSTGHSPRVFSHLERVRMCPSKFAGVICGGGAPGAFHPVGSAQPGTSPAVSPSLMLLVSTKHLCTRG